MCDKRIVRVCISEFIYSLNFVYTRGANSTDENITISVIIHSKSLNVTLLNFVFVFFCKRNQELSQQVVIDWLSS